MRLTDEIPRVLVRHATVLQPCAAAIGPTVPPASRATLHTQQ